MVPLRRGALLAAVAVAGALSIAGAAWESGAAAPGVEVVVELASPPLADAVAGDRQLQVGGSATRASARLDLASAGSRRALARIERDQAALERRIVAAIPQARIYWRYQVVLNGFAVVVPPSAIGRLERIAGVAHVTRSIAYHRQMDTTPGLIGAPTLWGTDFAGTGQGTRIAILDDGIEVAHPFFSPAGFTAPAGFPRGDLAYTSAKVIVARAFPPAGSTWKYAGTPFDPENSEHGVHVSGIAAGDRDTQSTGATKRVLSGVAPGAYLGNYKVLTTPTPGFGLDGNAPEIAAGVEAAVKDGMDVINLSLGEPEIEPTRDIVVKALGAAARAGVVPVVAAGNDYDVIGAGSVDSPGNTPEAITVAASSKSGIIADFSSAGPTPVSLQLKPDVTAPGLNIYSSFPTREDSWSSLSGTSMATPVVAGAAALLRQHHPGWTVAQIKSALISTGSAASDSAGKKTELPPTREGGGFISVARADAPLLFTAPASLSFGLVTPGTTVTRTVSVTDAGGGSGSWISAVDDVTSTPGVTIGVPGRFTVPAKLTITATATDAAREGDVSGFIYLTGSAGDRRIPFWLRVARPRLAAEPHGTIARPGVYQGNPRGLNAFVATYRYPDSGPALGIPTVLPGPEQLFRVRITGQVANFGAVVIDQAKGVEIDPRLVAAGNENKLTGLAGLPVDLNPYRNQYGEPTHSVAAIRPLPGLYDLVFDTPSVAKAGPFTFRTWVNDVTPPAVKLVSRTVAAGSTVKLELLITDAGSGVDPGSIDVKVDGSDADTTYDRDTGKTIATVSFVSAGTHKLSVSVSDYQEAKNMEDVPGVLPNSRTLDTTFSAS